MISAFFRLAIFGLLAAVLAACSPSGNYSASGPVFIDGPGAIGPVNAYRARNGLNPLTVDPRLTSAAAQHSARMASRNRMDHNLGGALPRRVLAAGYNWASAGENLGAGYPSYSSAMQGWIGSPGHRRNLLNPTVTHLGVAVARSPGGVPYWTQIFASER